MPLTTRHPLPLPGGPGRSGLANHSRPVRPARVARQRRLAVYRNRPRMLARLWRCPTSGVGSSGIKRCGACCRSRTCRRSPSSFRSAVAVPETVRPPHSQSDLPPGSTPAAVRVRASPAGPVGGRSPRCAPGQASPAAPASSHWTSPRQGTRTGSPSRPPPVHTGTWQETSRGSCLVPSARRRQRESRDLPTTLTASTNWDREGGRGRDTRRR